MGLLDYFDPDKARNALKGLLGGMPITQIAQGRSSVTANGLKAALMGMPIGDSESAYEAALNVGPMGLLGTTKFEKAHKLAQKNAALPVDAGGLGLPKNNTAADRAKALGFDTDAYHGTTKDFGAFDKDSVKSRFNYSFGHHTTTRPSEANYYAHDQLDITKSPYPEGGNVMPLKVRGGETLEYAAAHPSRSASTVADMDRAQIIHDIMQARKAGKNVDIVKTVRQFGDEYDGANFIAMRPELLRSRFAAFDPKRKDEADLLAAYFGIPLGRDE